MICVSEFSELSISTIENFFMINISLHLIDLQPGVCRLCCFKSFVALQMEYILKEQMHVTKPQIISLSYQKAFQFLRMFIC